MARFKRTKYPDGPDVEGGHFYYVSDDGELEVHRQAERVDREDRYGNLYEATVSVWDLYRRVNDHDLEYQDTFQTLREAIS